MPRQAQQPDPQYLDEHHQRIVEFADWAYEDDPEERELFVDYHLERRGYQRTTGWSVPPEPPPGPQGGGGAGGARPPAAGPRRPAYFRR